MSANLGQDRRMKSRGMLCGIFILAGLFAVFAACGADDANDMASDSADSSIGSDASADGSTDGTSTGDGQSADDAANDGGTITEAGTRSDGGPCTPRVGGPFVCGIGDAGTCTDSTSQYCIYGPVLNTCQPIPAECQCEETYSCECLVENLICDDGGLPLLHCTPHSDGGANELPDAATSSFFWIDAHECSVK